MASWTVAGTVAHILDCSSTMTARTSEAGLVCWTEFILLEVGLNFQKQSLSFRRYTIVSTLENAKLARLISRTKF